MLKGKVTRGRHMAHFSTMPANHYDALLSQIRCINQRAHVRCDDLVTHLLYDSSTVQGSDNALACSGWVI